MRKVAIKSVLFVTQFIVLIPIFPILKKEILLDAEPFSFLFFR